MQVLEIPTPTREAQLLHLYQQAFPQLARYIARQNGSFDEAKDIFQDALIIFYEKSATTETIANEKAYLLGIAKHLWLQRLREKQNETRLTDQQIPEEKTFTPSSTRLLRFLETAGKKCMDLLQAFYYQRRSMSEIADQFQFSGERSAIAQKYKCLEKVRDAVHQKSLRYDDFLE